MKKACQYCGKIHEKSYKCRKESYPAKHRDKKYFFRNSLLWRNKAKEIKVRDRYLCRVCLAELTLTSDNLSVHHIIPLEKCWESRLDNNNLITLCSYHHEQAEKGDIPASELKKLIPPTS